MGLPCIYLVDDEPEILKSLERVLMRLPITSKRFTSPKVALENLMSDKPVLVISDLRMPFFNGLEFLAEVKKCLPDTRRIMLSAHQDFEQIIEGFNHGVLHQFMEKPWNNKEIIDSIIPLLSSNSAADVQFKHFIGESKGISELKKQIMQVAGANVPIFIHGQTGTGKELVAKACHEKSHRASEPFWPINCANLSENLLESQLFGHKKGAFTGADKDFDGAFTQAGKGTIFLDEITTLPMPLQAKLLRVIQEREYMPLGGSKPLKLDAQIVSASSTALELAAASGEFRQDLYYRLAVIKLVIPPLNERGDDIMLLAKYFLDKYTQQYNKKMTSFSKDAQLSLVNNVWPGNVRQLENTIHHIVIMHDVHQIDREMLASALGQQPIFNGTDNDIHVLQPSVQVTSSASATEAATLADIEKHAILAAIDKHKGNITKAAAELDVNPSTIYRKMKHW